MEFCTTIYYVGDDGITNEEKKGKKIKEEYQKRMSKIANFDVCISDLEQKKIKEM